MLVESITVNRPQHLKPHKQLKADKIHKKDFKTNGASIPKECTAVNDHHGNGNRSTAILIVAPNGIDIGIRLFRQFQFFSQHHVYRNICGRTSGKESWKRAFFQTKENQWIGVFFNKQKREERVHN